MSVPPASATASPAASPASSAAASAASAAVSSPGLVRFRLRLHRHQRETLGRPVPHRGLPAFPSGRAYQQVPKWQIHRHVRQIHRLHSAGRGRDQGRVPQRSLSAGTRAVELRPQSRLHLQFVFDDRRRFRRMHYQLLPRKNAEEQSQTVTGRRRPVAQPPRPNKTGRESSSPSYKTLDR